MRMPVGVDDDDGVCCDDDDVSVCMVDTRDCEDAKIVDLTAFPYKYAVNSPCTFRACEQGMQVCVNAPGLPLSSIATNRLYGEQ
jgi:hypothetical protein